MARKNTNDLFLPTNAVYVVRNEDGSKWKKISRSKAQEIVAAPDPFRVLREDDIALLVVLPKIYEGSWESDASRGVNIPIWDWARGTLRCSHFEQSIDWVRSEERRVELTPGAELSRAAKSFSKLKDQLCKEPAGNPKRGRKSAGPGEIDDVREMEGLTGPLLFEWKGEENLYSPDGDGKHWYFKYEGRAADTKRVMRYFENPRARRLANRLANGG